MINVHKFCIYSTLTCRIKASIYLKSERGKSRVWIAGPNLLYNQHTSRLAHQVNFDSAVDYARGVHFEYTELYQSAGNISCMCKTNILAQSIAGLFQ